MLARRMQMAASAGGSTLLESLLAYWALEETGATTARADALGNNDLTVTGSITNVTGVQGNADEYASGHNLLFHAPNDTLSPGDTDWTLSFWHKVPGTADRIILGKWLGAGNQREYSIRITAGKYALLVSSDGAGNPTNSVSALTGGVVDTWVMVTVWHDSVNNLLGIQVDQATPVTKAYASGVFQGGTANFEIASVNNGTGTLAGDDIDEVGLWSRVLTSAERAELYNGGAGNTYPFDVAPAGLTVTNVSEYQVFQRSAGTADLLISGAYTSGSPAAIEARFNGGAWATIDASPAAGSYSGTLSGQAEGQGTLEVRFTNDTTVSASVANVGIGDVFLVAGQSNAEGRLTNAQSYSHGSLKAAVFDEAGAWRELTDPSDSDTAFGSVWPLLATLHMADQSVPVAFITVADGATGLCAPDALWAQGGASYTNMTNKITASNVNNILAILFAQGERDVVNGISAATYQTALSQFLDDFQTDTGFTSTVMIDYLAPAQYGTEDDASINAIRAAHINRWINDADIYPGPTGHDQSFADGLHWSTDAQGQRLANRWWRCIDAALFGGAEAARGPQFSTATRSGTTVTVTFTGGEGNLANQTDPTGFVFTDDGTPITINSAVANGTAAVDLTLNSTPAGTELISFAQGNDGAGATLSDSGTYPLPPEPFVDEVVT